jgi:alpha-tubulin suppressor-like RCC1 family protein
VTVSALTDPTSISAGYYDTCAVLAGESGRCWGDNDFGQLGDGTSVRVRVPERVRGIGTLDQISKYQSHTCGVTVEGTPYCWGINSSGELGTGTTGGAFTAPQPVLVNW